MQLGFNNDMHNSHHEVKDFTFSVAFKTIEYITVKNNLDDIDSQLQISQFYIHEADISKLC